MNYELIKQLREAGHKGELDLSSLIEACGDGFNVLTKQSKSSWNACKETDYGEIVGEQGVGETPEEAVAKLFIKLNQ